jgi:hypothetical protein
VNLIAGQNNTGKRTLLEAIRLHCDPGNCGLVNMGLLPIMWSAGTGADVMKRIAAPMVGGIVTSFIMELLIYPAVYAIWKWWAEARTASPKDAVARL